MTGFQVPSAGASTAHRASHARPVVFIVDGDDRIRDALGHVIRRAGWTAELFASAGAFLAHPRQLAPGCVVMDTKLPDLDGLDLQHRLAGRGDLPIIFIASDCDVAMAVRAMKAGAVEVLTKPCSDDAPLAAIRDALDRSRRALEEAEQKCELRDCLASLTARECEVLTLLFSGMMNKQVAAELGISEITVKAHRGSVMRKMKARSFADLVNMAVQLGLPRLAKAGSSTDRVPPSTAPALVFRERRIRYLLDAGMTRPG